MYQTELRASFALLIEGESILRGYDCGLAKKNSNLENGKQVKVPKRVRARIQNYKFTPAILLETCKPPIDSGSSLFSL
jgi:hypothetical protein